MRYLSALTVAVAAVSLCACSSTVAELAKDPATVSVHQVITAPGWSVTTDYVRNNSTGATASAGAAGTTANIPSGSVLQSAPGATTGPDK